MFHLNCRNPYYFSLILSLNISCYYLIVVKKNVVDNCSCFGSSDGEIVNKKTKRKQKNDKKKDTKNKKEIEGIEPRSYISL